MSCNRGQNPANSGALSGMNGSEQGPGRDTAPGLRLSDIREYVPVVADSNSTDFEPPPDAVYKPAPLLTAKVSCTFRS